MWSKLNLFLGGARVEVKGAENVIRGGSQIFASNHQSICDILVLAGYLPVQFRWIAKKELFRIPFMGWHMSRGGYIRIDRSSLIQSARSVREAAAQIRGGKSVVIFPEGTRSPDGRLQPFKRGAFSLAILAQVPVVPVAISGSHKVVRKGSLRVHPGRIRVVIDKPIPTEGYTTKDKAILAEKVRSVIIKNLTSEASNMVI
ncbi:1-acyl-sn-glycerol-3-phosphate acyltransferase [bacterium (candidate division B38) B3_B38]|nr:MAG: 1-acyl-sn-glycerol-3-phosphate acyltransferase [bacterium (candidate division B38) B3_B38]